jgi:aryl-alcohol dehydrogenase-like predicted oxidoreductase
MTNRSLLGRRDFLKLAGAAALAGSLPTGAAAPAMHTRPIPSSSEALPVIGLGTAHQFDVPSDPESLGPLRQVLETLIGQGARVVDTSPMYGRAEAVLGHLLEAQKLHDRTFLATKVWTRGLQDGISQMKASLALLRTDSVDLMQVHNLIDWRTHMDTLRAWKEQGTIRYTGMTHYRTDAFGELGEAMRAARPDFVQLNYSILTPDAEERLLPLARDLGVAVLVNLPYERGEVFKRVQGKALPPVAAELGCASWGQFFLKWILGNPAVTCVIPGTSRPTHALDNAGAGFGPLPDEAQRAEMRNALAL